MTAPVWLIESDVYGPEIDTLADEIRQQGMACRFVTYREIVKGPRPLPPGACAIVYGTYPTVRHALLHCGWRPGGWCSPERLDCTAYYPHFQNHILNQRYEILPGVAALREKARLFRMYGRDGKVFARPTSTHKLFVGRLIAEEEFDSALAPTRYNPESRVVIAEPQDIRREWRVVVAGDAVVAGSQYAEAGERSVTAEFPNELRDYACALLTAVKWRPDPLFMLDLCETERGFALVELNSFSCSWLYACNHARVVEIASRFAAESMNNVVS